MTEKRYTSSMESDETIQHGAKTLKKGSQSRTEKLRVNSTKTGRRNIRGNVVGVLVSPAGKLHLLSLELWVSFVSALP
ncbi:hypothetical protein TNCV_966191 [Trichonephila clavipes]|nr:hypothetical protein TNCV_966191 [Trichonephila clavipes]